MVLFSEAFVSSKAKYKNGGGKKANPQNQKNKKTPFYVGEWNTIFFFSKEMFKPMPKTTSYNVQDKKIRYENLGKWNIFLTKKFGINIEFNLFPFYFSFSISFFLFKFLHFLTQKSSR